MILRDTIVEGLLDGKAKDVVCLDMRKIDGSICDYFVTHQGAFERCNVKHLISICLPSLVSLLQIEEL